MLMNAKRPKPEPKRRKKSTEAVLTPVWRTDARPDPAAMSEADRATEFGRIIFRAIERKQAKAKK